MRVRWNSVQQRCALVLFVIGSMAAGCGSPTTGADASGMDTGSSIDGGNGDSAMQADGSRTEASAMDSSDATEASTGSTDSGTTDASAGADTAETGATDSGSGPDAAEAGATDSGVGMDVTDAGGDDANDAAPDAVVSKLFAPCATASDCDPGMMCMTNFPGGLCTKSCASDRNCQGGVGFGECLNGTCYQYCAPGGNDCATSSACYSNAAFSECYASCYASPPSGVAGCVAGTTCNTYTGQCQTLVTYFGPGDTGDPCASDSTGLSNDCKSGQCNDAWSGGYCYSVGRMLDATAFVHGQPLPQSNCPDGSVVLPDFSLGPGDAAVCYRQCQSNADCRTGYHCNRYPMTPGGTDYQFTIGACVSN